MGSLERGERRGDACPRLEVALGQEEEDDLRVADVRLQRADVLKVIDVKKDLDTSKQLLELILDDGDGVL